MKVEDFDYDLPEELIAQKPAPNRDMSRLMILDRHSGAIAEGRFKDIIDYLNPDDLLILNNSRVIPARLFGRKEPTNTQIEVLLLRKWEEEKDCWEALVRPGRRVKKGAKIVFGEGKLIAEVIAYTDFGGRILQFDYQGDFNQILDELGELPLPPYIKNKLDNPERYQTVYAEKRGSVAAPTAGLHFTAELLTRIQEKRVKVAYLTLHVGLGTFRPVQVEKVEEHKMHSEFYELNSETAQKIRETKAKGGRVIAVGTTVTRVLETVATERGSIEAARGWTDIFIYPGYEFKVIDALITNFHLPRSTLLMLISAFAGREKVLRAYQKAVEKKYRFFSLGDAMFIK